MPLPLIIVAHHFLVKAAVHKAIVHKTVVHHGAGAVHSSKKSEVGNELVKEGIKHEGEKLFESQNDDDE